MTIVHPLDHTRIGNCLLCEFARLKLMIVSILSHFFQSFSNYSSNSAWNHSVLAILNDENSMNVFGSNSWSMIERSFYHSLLLSSSDGASDKISAYTFLIYVIRDAIINIFPNATSQYAI